MSFGIDRRARAKKGKGGVRGWFGGRAADPAELGLRLGKIAKRIFGSAISKSAARRVVLRFVPRTPALALEIEDDGALAVRGLTAPLGPGYHAYVLGALAPLLAELELEWDEPTGLALEAIQDEMTEWLADELRDGARAFGMPAGRVFVTGAAVNTPLGPRDAAWRDAVLADPLHAADAFPWWDARPGAAARARALLGLWHDVPWRTPIDDDERALLARAEDDLHAALAAHADAELPWAAWVELHEHGGDPDPLDARVTDRAAAAAEPAGPVGYRRYPLEIEIAGGWTMALPGAFVTHVEEDTDRWWASDGDRVVEATTFTAAADSPADSAALLAIAPELHPCLARDVEGDRCARAEAHTIDEIHVVVGLVARAPHVAILTCKSHDPDPAWALALWRSLRI